MKGPIKLTRNDGYYLPLFNLKGLKASITPFFGGDLKLDQHHFALQPVSELSLYENIHSRNVIFTVNQQRYYLNGQLPHQLNDDVTYDFGMLYQVVMRKNELFSLKTTSFIPVNETVEAHQIEIKNESNKPLTFDVITAIPLYGRSADNIRDHRHVTSLLHRVFHHEQGIMVEPTLSFDERGHLRNHVSYSVFADIKDVKVNRLISTLDDFIDGGSMNYPLGIYRKDVEPKDGYETIGAIGFEPFTLNPGESKLLHVTIGIHHNKKIAIDESLKYFNPQTFQVELAKTNAFFAKYPHQLSFSFHSESYEQLLKWVSLQPVLRRHLGNSFLPHHDYGRGGRGWRDLWQDLLALIMFNDGTVKDLLENNFKGIRIDGSNATIIGDEPGEFKADRNNIVRIWSDHGAWPLLTVKMYLDETGDIPFLLKKQTYFDDQFTHYTYKTKQISNPDHILSVNNISYEGTILEHLMLQNIVAHQNVGEFGFVKLEDADWNDGLDMAKKQGETIAFTHFYANNLRLLADMIEKLNVETVELFEDLYELIMNKLNLQQFFDAVSTFNGKTIHASSKELIDQLRKLAEERINYLQNRGWLKDYHYQSYINNDGLFADSKDTMSLTGQAMALLSETATKSQAITIAKHAKALLFDKEVGGYHLNSFYDAILLNIGRAYGFAYGHKENGAVFSHMVMMYAYGLYNYDLSHEAREAYQTLLNQAIHPDSKVLAGIPEYFNNQGHGKYLYLTGSASWLLKLLRTHVFGLKFNYGVLNLEPKLEKDDFIEGKASIKTYIFGRLTKVTYHNDKNLDLNQYKISKIMMGETSVSLPLSTIDGDLEVYLDEISSV